MMIYKLELRIILTRQTEVTVVFHHFTHHPFVFSAQPQQESKNDVWASDIQGSRLTLQLSSLVASERFDFTSQNKSH